MSAGSAVSADAALLAAARAAREAAYVPYSGFAVGAALRTTGGAVIGGCNVENAAYAPTICAERTAVVSAVAAGHRAFEAIAISGPDDEPISPCGVCRQVLHEFAPALRVVSPDGRGGTRALALPDLLPDAFGPDRLG